MQTLLGTNKKTNGPEGTIASKTVKSVAMINQGLVRLTKNIRTINPDLVLNPEALLTVKVENLHAVSHFKLPTCMQLHYARDFGDTVLEAAKRMTNWSAFYFTRPTSYYPVPSAQIHLKDFPRMRQQNKLQMRAEDQEQMRLWARDNGKCVRQRTVRQETTKYKAGTLPLNMYQTAVRRSERLDFPVDEDEEQLGDDENEGHLGDDEDEGHLVDDEDEGHLRDDVHNEGQMRDVDNEGQLRDVANEKRLKNFEIEGNVGNVKARRENAIESEVDQLSEYDNSSESSDSLSAAEEVEEEYDGQNEANNHVQNKELNFLFAPGRTRSGQVVKTSARAMLWM